MVQWCNGAKRQLPQSGVRPQYVKNTFCIFEKCFYGIKNFDPQEKCCTFAMDLKIQASLGCARDSKIKYLDSPLAGTSLASVKR
jgi:hypothetical protein